MVKVKVFSYVGQRLRSRSPGKKNWYGWKGLLTRNVHVKYDSPTSYESKVMVKVKVFRYKVKGYGQGHQVKKFGMDRKVFSQGMYM